MGGASLRELTGSGSGSDSCGGSSGDDATARLRLGGASLHHCLRSVLDGEENAIKDYISISLNQRP
jgi:hypothetical protein